MLTDAELNHFDGKRMSSEQTGCIRRATSSAPSRPRRPEPPLQPGGLVALRENIKGSLPSYGSGSR
jgi:hypothetical protein